MQPGVLTRYLTREILAVSVAVAVVLLAVLITNRFARFLADAAGGGLPTDAILQLLGLELVAHLSLLLPGAFFLAVVLALGRLYRDNEMAALAACGVGPARLYRILAVSTVPLTLLVAVLAFVIGPYGAAERERVQAEAQRNVQLEALRAGRFVTSGGFDGVLYAERIGADGEHLENVLLQSETDDGIVVITAREARLEFEPETGGRYFIMFDGYRYDGRPGEAGWRQLAFAEHGVLIEQQPLRMRTRFSAMSTGELLAANTAPAWAELHWRLAMPISVVLLVLLAVPLSWARPRSGRYAKLLVAVLVYAVYFNALTVSQDALKDGALPAGLGLWGVHAALLAAGVLWLRARYGRRTVVEPKETP